MPNNNKKTKKLLKNKEDKIEYVLELVERELRRAMEIHPDNFHSYHEGYAIIEEELDELKEQVWMKAKFRNKEQMKSEAIQLSAMGARFCADLLI